ncbi:HAUS augmin-like complex subunit 8 isoform X2 [Nycticebus coucang]|uniref:HAUS augmin-like complex subunit 8 isoform X2 n=1 Tax=Nycticebus coucang TaxID=9470 RepID=UPI00234D5130|nr:HAUS augmin-like complex subunit 8 isoform X2 [Nycticebus coucang]
MADSSERGVGKLASAGSGAVGGARKKERSTRGGRVVESRYMDYEKKRSKKQSPEVDAPKSAEKISDEGGKKPSLYQESKAESRGIRKPHVTGDHLQSTFLEGHDMAPPDLDLSVIKDERMVGQLERKTKSRKPAHMEKCPMEKGLAQFEQEAEKKLLVLDKEKEKWQKKAHDLKRRLLLCQKKRELEDVLDTQITMLSPFEEVATRFKEQYKTFATALDSTRHELPVRLVHMGRDKQQYLDTLQAELMTTQQLLRDLAIGKSEENVQALDLLSELQDLTVEKDLELRRYNTTEEKLLIPINTDENRTM